MDVDEQPNASKLEALAAIERRIQPQESKPSTIQLRQEQELRQKFRRLIDPGIVRPNSEEQARATIKILLTLAENLLREPDNKKYQRFKPTNTTIKKNLMDPKGAVEYAIEMGFRPIVDDFQPFYEWNPRHLEKLRVGTFILQEHNDRVTERLERQARARETEAAAKEAQAERVRLAFMDDRMSKEYRDQMEREARAGRQAAAALATKPPRQTKKAKMPGPGISLSGETVPPEYESGDEGGGAEDDDDDDDDSGSESGDVHAIPVSHPPPQ
ncbi:hypothetical protein DL96DRAFT_1593260 [Flagelloscypha sp. PMI_526]|nr:hypothetical protein DL96DRAFT_1593260 [Flagelloscypha sp. PMI_526]